MKQYQEESRSQLVARVMRPIDRVAPVTLVKIGGSLVSDKTKPYSVREDALAAIAREVKKCVDAGFPILLGHGAGSFAHVPAKKYQTHRGVLNDESVRGFVEVAAAARRFHQINMEALLAAGVPAVSIAPLSCMTGSNHQLGTIDSSPIILALRLGLVPVVFGDPILDDQVGCTIFPTEQVLRYVALDVRKRGFSIARIIHCSASGGVLDAAGNTIDRITPQFFEQNQSLFGASNGIDVSGGMLQKVRETLELASLGIPGLIIDGLQTSLADAVAGATKGGTRIELD